MANTYTLNFSYGLGLVADGTGVLLNNELDDFTAKPGAANAYGLVGFDANLPGPGKRPLSSMTPTIVLKDGKPFLVTGSPGGSRIITAVLQVIVNVIDFHMPIAEAVSAPRLHHQWQPDEVFVEPGFAPDVLDALASARPQRSCRREPAHLGEFDRGHDRRLCRRRRHPHPRRAGGGVLSIADIPAARTSVRDAGMTNWERKLERAKGFEPSTPTLARSCSTPELHPHPLDIWPKAQFRPPSRSYSQKVDHFATAARPGR